MLALAIQGIGGMNAFAAGVLQQFRKNGIEPELISATSGAIYSTYLYLDENPEAIHQYFEEITEDERDIIPDELQFMRSVMLGVPGKFRPVYPLERIVENYPFSEPKQWMNFFFPAKVFQPTYPDSFYEKMAKRFSASSIGIMINAYHYEKDKAILYLNRAAMRKTGLKPGETTDYIVKEMSADGVRNSLQLLQYGERNGEYDGAYQYNPVVGPLKKASRIILITVESIEKSLHKIENYFDTQDFLLKMLFKNALHSELRNIRLINKLIAEGIVTHKRYHPIDIQIIQPSTYRGYFDYFVEDYAFFQDGIKQGMEFLNAQYATS